ncbi:MAG TPA: DUF1810 domain-containing protein [Spirochaetia bacterium]|nr:DUF1810 domain-containing protein [Spirochaetia bacterium]
MNDSFNLQRFVDAQETVLEAVTRELQAGAKRSHWMWFVFPQIKGLGYSTTAHHYALGSIDEAKAYLLHPLLGRRLRNWTQIVLEVEERTAEAIFGYPDYLKFRSSMTLFDAAERNVSKTENPSVFARALQKYFQGEPDPATLRILGLD